MRTEMLASSRPLNCSSFAADPEIPIQSCSELFPGPKQPPFHRSCIGANHRPNLGQRKIFEFEKNQCLALQRRQTSYRSFDFLGKFIIQPSRNCSVTTPNPSLFRHFIPPLLSPSPIL